MWAHGSQESVYRSGGGVLVAPGQSVVGRNLQKQTEGQTGSKDSSITLKVCPSSLLSSS